MHVLHEFGPVSDGPRLWRYPDILPIPAGDRLRFQPVLAEYGARPPHRAPAIAGFLKMRERQAGSWIEKQTLPTFNIRKTICARRSTLNAWLAEREADARRVP